MRTPSNNIMKNIDNLQTLSITKTCHFLPPKIKTYWGLIIPKGSTPNIQFVNDEANPRAHSECPEALNEYFVSVFIYDKL